MNLSKIILTTTSFALAIGAAFATKTQKTANGVTYFTANGNLHCFQNVKTPCGKILTNATYFTSFQGRAFTYKALAAFTVYTGGE